MCPCSCVRLLDVKRCSVASHCWFLLEDCDFLAECPQRSVIITTANAQEDVRSAYSVVRYPSAACDNVSGCWSLSGGDLLSIRIGERIESFDGTKPDLSTATIASRCRQLYTAITVGALSDEDAIDTSPLPARVVFSGVQSATAVKRRKRKIARRSAFMFDDVT